MKNTIKPSGYSPLYKVMMLFLLLAIIIAGCQTQRNVVKSKDGKLSVDKETIIKDLTSIIDPDSELTTEEKTALLQAIKDHGFQDAQVDSLISVAENSMNSIALEKEVPQKSPTTAVEGLSKNDQLEDILTDQFNALINPGADDSSDDIILETLNYFESNDAPVLIILQELNGKIFYDRPTTIEKYLYYLKDLKKNYHQIQEMNLNNNEKINKLILASK